jgi:hypothetical protein
MYDAPIFILPGASAAFVLSPSVTTPENKQNSLIKLRMILLIIFVNLVGENEIETAENLIGVKSWNFESQCD